MNNSSVKRQKPNIPDDDDDNIVEEDTDEEDEQIDVKSTPATEKVDAADYGNNVTYDKNNKAIYTDPTTKTKYEWDKEKNEWGVIVNDQLPASDNKYENEHYIWDFEKSEWVPKENEFYKWSEEKREWIPKVDNAEKTYGYDEQMNCHTYTDTDGMIFFWDTEKNAWFPKIDDEFMAQYQLRYGVVGSESNEPVEKQTHYAIDNKMEKAVSSFLEEECLQKNDETRKVQGTGKPNVQKPASWFDIEPELNTKVYVSNLPLDITEDEFIELMSKCGMIVRDLQTKKIKVKLYKDGNGQLKGDGLVNYIKVESVALAINILDGTELRGKKISIQPAKFEMRGEYNAAMKPKHKKKDKEKIRLAQEKLLDWRPERMRGERAKHERVVIIKNLFDPTLFERDVELIIDYQKDLREECGKCGKVRKVIIYDRHPDGVAQVSMADPEEADSVVLLLNGRFFSQRQLQVELWDGKTKYQVKETETENRQRISDWEKFLEDERIKEEETNQNNDRTNEEKVEDLTANKELECDTETKNIDLNEDTFSSNQVVPCVEED